MILFRANYIDPEDKKTHRVTVISVDLKIKKALILHGQRDLIIVNIDEIKWASYD